MRVRRDPDPSDPADPDPDSFERSYYVRSHDVESGQEIQESHGVWFCVSRVCTTMTLARRILAPSPSPLTQLRAAVSSCVPYTPAVITIPAGVLQFDGEISTNYFQNIHIAGGGGGAEAVVLSGGGSTRLFSVAAYSSLALSDISLVNGTISTSICSKPYYECAGAAIYNGGGFVTLVRCIVKNNVGWVRPVIRDCAARRARRRPLTTRRRLCTCAHSWAVELSVLAALLAAL